MFLHLLFLALLHFAVKLLYRTYFTEIGYLQVALLVYSMWHLVYSMWQYTSTAWRKDRSCIIAKFLHCIMVQIGPPTFFGVLFPME